jgi:hypothetical protein
MLKEKIERLELGGKRIQFSLESRGTAELKLMKVLTEWQSSQSKKTETAKYYYQWQILKPSGEIKVKRIFTVSVKTQKESEKAALKGTTGMAHLHGSAR